MSPTIVKIKIRGRSWTDFFINGVPCPASVCYRWYPVHFLHISLAFTFTSWDFRASICFWSWYGSLDRRFAWCWSLGIHFTNGAQNVKLRWRNSHHVQFANLRCCRKNLPSLLEVILYNSRRSKIRSGRGKGSGISLFKLYSYNLLGSEPERTF